MIYGISDIVRNMAGLKSSHILRKEEFWAVDDISLTIKEGETLGIVGPNGAGKTTLLKLLNGIYWPDRGKIVVRGKVGALIELGAGFHPMLTGRENIYVNSAVLGMTKKEVDKKFDSIVDFSEIGDFLDTPVKHYSSGMYVRLGFSIAIHCEPDILLIDEVLAVGDEGFQKKCFNKLGEVKKNGTTILLVSHNMHNMSTFAEKIVLVNRGTAQYYNKVADGIKEYNRLFKQGNNLQAIEQIACGNEIISFYDVKIDRLKLVPGDSFVAHLHYRTVTDYKDVEIDVAIICAADSGLYFQATNRTFKKSIDLTEGEHEISIKIDSIYIHDSFAKVAIAVWSKNRHELLFWWRIPVEFETIDGCNGSNFINMTFTES